MRTLMLLLSLLALPAFGAGISGTFTYPAKFVDGTTLSLAQIAQMRIEYGSCAGTAFGTKAGEVVVTPPATSYSIPNVAPGAYCLRAFTKTTAAAGAQESDSTNVLQHTVPWPKPEPGTLVTVSTMAYDFTLDRHGTVKLGRAVGTVPLGTACGEVYVTKRSAVFADVPRGAVSLTRAPRSSLILAQCAGA